MSKRKIKILVCVGCLSLGTFIGTSIAKFFHELEEQKVRQSTFPNLQNCLHALKNSLVKDLGNSNSRIFVIREHGDFVSTWPEFEADIKEVAVIGFDCEWTTTKENRGKVALMQLATYTGLTLLIQLNRLTALPTSLLSCLSDGNIVKVGVGCMDDAKKLMNDRSITVNGCFDLRFLVDHHSLSAEQNLSLKALCSRYLNIHLSKPRHIQCGNWDVTTLSSHQIKYAAKDATVGIQIFVSAMMERFLDRPNNIIKLLDDSLRKQVWNEMFAECLKFRDLKFKDLRRTRGNRSRSRATASRSIRSVKATKSYTSRKTPMYDNCMLQAPDGGDLTTCNRKKADWYVQRGLAAVINEDPYVVRLNFVPAGRPDSKDDYYLQQRENQCVVCGSEDKIVRKNIIPHEYRKYFPMELKSHDSHDILPLCISCHHQSAIHDDQLRQQISKELDTSLSSETDSQYFEDKEKKSVRSAGHALVKMGDCIPQERKRELEGYILRYFNESTLNDALIEKASKLDTKIKNDNFVPHAEVVVRKLMRKKNPFKKLCEFEKVWRKNFVMTMAPKHLPEKWSVDYKRSNEKIQPKKRSKTRFDPHTNEEGTTAAAVDGPRSCHVNQLNPVLEEFTEEDSTTSNGFVLTQPKNSKFHLMTENVSSSSDLSYVDKCNNMSDNNTHHLAFDSNTVDEKSCLKTNTVERDECKAAVISDSKLIDLHITELDDDAPALDLYTNNDHLLMATIECDRQSMKDCENAAIFNTNNRHFRETACGETLPTMEDKTGDNNWSIKVDKSEGGGSFGEENIGDQNFNYVHHQPLENNDLDLIPNDAEPETDASAVYPDDEFEFGMPQVHDLSPKPDQEPSHEFNHLLDKVEVDSRSDESMLCVDNVDTHTTKGENSMYNEASDPDNVIEPNLMGAIRTNIEVENIFALTHTSDTNADSSGQSIGESLQENRSDDELPNPAQLQSNSSDSNTDEALAGCAESWSLKDSGVQEELPNATEVAECTDNHVEKYEVDSTVGLSLQTSDTKLCTLGSDVDSEYYIGRDPTTDQQEESGEVFGSEIEPEERVTQEADHNVKENTSLTALEGNSAKPESDLQTEDDVTVVELQNDFVTKDTAGKPLNDFEAISQKQGGDQSEFDRPKSCEQKSPVHEGNPIVKFLIKERDSCVDSGEYFNVAATTSSHVRREIKVKANKSESSIETQRSNDSKMSKKSGSRFGRSSRNSPNNKSTTKSNSYVSLCDADDNLKARLSATLMANPQFNQALTFSDLSKIKLGSKGSAHGKACNSNNTGLRLPRKSMSRRLRTRDANIKYAMEKSNLKLEAKESSKLETETTVAESCTKAASGVDTSLYNFIPNVFKALSVNVDKNELGSDVEEDSSADSSTDHSDDCEPCESYQATADENSSTRVSTKTRASSLSISDYTEIIMSCPDSSSSGSNDADPTIANYDYY